MRRAEGTFAQGVQKPVQGSHVGADIPVETLNLIVGWIKDACGFVNSEVAGETERQFEDSPAWSSPSARLEGAVALLISA
jgi:hypothetical protein